MVPDPAYRIAEHAKQERVHPRFWWLIIIGLSLAAWGVVIALGFLLFDLF